MTLKFYILLQMDVRYPFGPLSAATKEKSGIWRPHAEASRAGVSKIHFWMSETVSGINDDAHSVVF